MPTPQSKLALLINCVKLPPEPFNTSDSTGSYTVSNSQINLHLLHRQYVLRHSPYLITRPSYTLFSLADGILPADPAPLATFFTTVSDQSRRDALAGTMSGELGETIMFQQALLLPLNRYLSLLLDGSGHDLWWQTVGSRPPSGKPQVHLLGRNLAEGGSDGAHNPRLVQPKVLAIYELTTDKVLSDDLLISIPQKIADGLITVVNGLIVGSDRPHAPTTSQDKEIKILNQVFVQVHACRVKWAFLGNYNYLLPIYLEDDVGQGSTYVFGTPIHMAANSSEDSLGASIFGFFLGISLAVACANGLGPRPSFGGRPALSCTVEHPFSHSPQSSAYTLSGGAISSPSLHLSATHIAPSTLRQRPQTPHHSPSATVQTTPKDISVDRLLTPPLVESKIPVQLRVPQRTGQSTLVPVTVTRDPPTHDASLPNTLSILEEIGKGALSKVYHAKLRVSGTDTDCIAKVVDVSSFPVEAYHGHTQEGAREAFLHEIDILQHLAPIQGDVLPILYGWGEVGSVLYTLLENVGSPVPRENRSILKDRVFDLYGNLQRAGVLHGDIEWRHIFSRPDGSLALIDFDQAYKRSVETDTEWANVGVLSEVHEHLFPDSWERYMAAFTAHRGSGPQLSG